VKADMGPGRFDKKFLSRTSELGLKFFPGLPNGTEVCQELDQDFSAMKSKIYANRDMLYDARCRILGIANAKVTFEDAGYLIFGGKVQITNEFTGEDEVVLLPYSYITGLSSYNLYRSRRKVGYWPATRKSLFSNQVAVNIILEEESNNEASNQHCEVVVDPFQALLVETRDLNHRLVDSLISKGYRLAAEAKRDLKEVGADEIHRSMELAYTEPHTRERQNRLQTIHQAGQFYRYTFGGAILNSSDYLLALERKDMLAEYENLKKKKESVLQYHDEIIPAAMIAFKRSYKKWSSQIFYYAVKYKQGIELRQGEEKVLKSASKSKLKEAYEKLYKGHKRSTVAKESVKWTEEDEQRMNNCEKGVINDLTETAIFGNAVEANNEYIVARLDIVSSSRRKNIITNAIQKCTSHDKIALVEEVIKSLNDNERNAYLLNRFCERDGESMTINDTTTLYDKNDANADDMSLATISDGDESVNKNAGQSKTKKEKTANETGKKKYSKKKDKLKTRKQKRVDLLLGSIDDNSCSCNDNLNDEADSFDERINAMIEQTVVVNTELLDGSINEEESSSCDGVCASGKHCRCPWDESKFAHTCFECKKPVHSFCFGWNEEGGKSKCALCVLPNGVCEYSMNFFVPGPGLLLVEHTSLADDSNEIQSVLNDSERDKARVEHRRGEVNEDLIFNDISILDEESVQSDNHEGTKNPDVPNSLLENMPAQDDNLSSELNDDLETATATSVEQDGSNRLEVILDDHSNNENKENNTQAKKFEEMNEDELRNEFLKRNMNIGRIKKKSTFIARLTKYDAKEKS
jgi:hypothetical protein